MNLTEEQNYALKSVAKWFLEDFPNGKQWFYLGGYAGTGKTTIAKYIAETLNKKIVYGAFTGKAASVLRKKGCHGASTIHSMIYIPELDSNGNVINFRLNSASSVCNCDMVIIDEVSMVGETIAMDLLSFGKPVLVLGDPAQLPPVKDAAYFTKKEPDFMLKEVHRQALNNPIIELSMKIRRGENIGVGVYGGKVEVKLRRDVLDQEIIDAEQIIVGMNKTRRDINGVYRDLTGKKGAIVSGERLVCLKNNNKKKFLNGTLWNVEKVVKEYQNSRRIKIISEDGFVSGMAYVHNSSFDPFIPEDKFMWKYDPFDYGYALTAHKCQGSQFSSVLIFDESFVFREHKNKWMYTAITRAEDTATILV